MTAQANARTNAGAAAVMKKSGEIFTTPQQNKNQYDRLELFELRCGDLRHQVLTGRMAFIDAVDLAWSAAIWSGLVDDAGPDVCQHVLARAFMAVPR